MVMMIKKVVFVFVFSFVSGWMCAQDLGFEKGTFGLDRNKGFIVVTGQENSVETVHYKGVTYKLYRTTLPVINIVTDGEIVNSPAVHGVISVGDANGHVIEMHAGFKIRGTSSQQYDKKSYRVELWADATGTTMADTTFLGMRSDDDWNLEAMWAQPLRLRDKVANELWMEMYTLPYAENEPDALPGIRMEYADLFINDEYKGVYALTERMDRKQLGLKKYNGEIRGVLYKGNGPGAPTFESLPAYDNTLGTWDNYEWVYPNEEEASYNWSSLYSFTNFVMNSSDNVFNAQYNAQFNKDNAIDYYLFINAIGAIDNMGRNLFLARYNKSGTYFYLPWDLDAIWGLDAEGNQSNNAEGLMGNGFFDRLINDCSANGYVASARARYNALRNSVLTRSYIMQLVQDQYNELLECGAYDREHEAWPGFTVDANQLTYLSNWLDARFGYLDAEINLACGTWDVEETVENENIDVFPNPTNDRITVRFAEVGDAVVRLYDLMGRLVYSDSRTTQTFVIPTSGMAKGVYTLVACFGESQLISRVVVE